MKLPQGQVRKAIEKFGNSKASAHRTGRGTSLGPSAIWDIEISTGNGELNTAYIVRDGDGIFTCHDNLDGALDEVVIWIDDDKAALEGKISALRSKLRAAKTPSQDRGVQWFAMSLIAGIATFVSVLIFLGKVKLEYDDLGGWLLALCFGSALSLVFGKHLVDFAQLLADRFGLSTK